MLPSIFKQKVGVYFSLYFKQQLSWWDQKQQWMFPSNILPFYSSVPRALLLSKNCLKKHLTKPTFGQGDMFPHYRQLTGWVHCWFWSLQGFLLILKRKKSQHCPLNSKLTPGFLLLSGWKLRAWVWSGVHSVVPVTKPNSDVTGYQTSLQQSQKLSDVQALFESHFKCSNMKTH